MEGAWTDHGIQFFLWTFEHLRRRTGLLEKFARYGQCYFIICTDRNNTGDKLFKSRSKTIFRKFKECSLRPWFYSGSNTADCCGNVKRFLLHDASMFVRKTGT